MAYPTTLCLGDIHFPWAKWSLLNQVIKLTAQIKPKRIVQVGDLYDMYSYSRFARSVNLMTPKQEVESGRKMAEKLWKELQKAAGKGVECYQLKGNHDERFANRMLAAVPEFEHLLSNGLWCFDGVKTQESERQELILGNVCFLHGYRRHGDHVKFNLMSTVCGHTHLGGVIYHRQRNDTIWELNCGYLADPSTVPLSYSQQSKFSRMTHGVGLIDSLGPRFIPL
jgi:UDP-2,3-diacylglucosamine pyrophosphatase LpxH